MDNGLTFKVTGTQQQQQLTQSGSTVIYYRVWIVTSRGASGSVDIPKDDWTAEKVAAILSRTVQELDLAFDLTAPKG